MNDTKTAAAAVMEKLAGEELDTSSTVPGEGAAGTDDLEAEVGDSETKSEGEEATSSAEAETSEVAEVEDTDADPLAQAAKEEATLLKDSGLVKLSNGEFIPKKTFLKEIKKVRAKAKEFETRYKEYESKKESYARWDEHQDKFEGAVRLAADLNEALKQHPWAGAILGPLMDKKLVNWEDVTKALKPMLNPFWDGTQVQAETEPKQADPEIVALKKKFEAMEEKEKQSVIQTKQKEYVDKQSETYVNTVKNLLDPEKGRWKKYSNDVYKDLLYDRAEAIQAKLPEGYQVDISKVANDLFGRLDSEAKAKLTKLKESKARMTMAAGETPGKIGAVAIKSEEAPKTDREARGRLAAELTARFGKLEA